MAYTIKKLPEWYEENNQVQAWTQVGWYTVKSVPITQSRIDDNKKAASNIAKWVWVTAWLLWTSKAIWKGLEWIWKRVYGWTLDPNIAEARNVQSYAAWSTNIKPRTVIDTAIESPLFQKWSKNSLISKWWMMGTKEMIWVQAEAAANNIFKDTINPIMQQAEKDGIKIKYSDLIKQAENTIKNSTKYAESEKKTIINDIKELAKNYKWTTSLKNLDLEKQAIANRIPKKYQNAAKVSNELKAAQKELANQFRKAVHNTIQKEYWVNSAKLYHEYANFKNLSEIWPKAATNSAMKWWAGSFTTNAWQSLWSLPTTVWWKVTYKVWKWLQKPRDMITNAAKKLAKWWTKETAKEVWKTVVKETWKTTTKTATKNIWKTIAKEWTKNVAKWWLKGLAKWVGKWLLNPVNFVMPDFRDMPKDNQYSNIKNLVNYAQWNWDWATKKEAELLERNGWSINTQISQIVNDLKSNKQFNEPYSLRWKKYTLRELLESNWSNPDEVLNILENYLQTWWWW